ncbi:hypothetical protein NP534_23980, partial [Pseudomonas sp. 39004]|uniref:hypothetical protein n=1 Tax=Pseudomonas sp. 39004 TaxID=2967213 RepID=UPI002363CFD8
KKSACYASAVLFLLCQSRYLLFLLGVSFFLFLYQRYSRARANFYKPFKINHLSVYGKNAGPEILSICFPVTRFFAVKRGGGNTPPTFM